MDFKKVPRFTKCLRILKIFKNLFFFCKSEKKHEIEKGTEEKKLKKIENGQK